MKPHKLVFLLSLAVLAFASACSSTERTAPDAQATPTQQQGEEADEALLATDSSVRIGQLDNGLSYYIRRNSEPADRAELRLAIDVGSVLETPQERGLAHFIEHMLFNGTRRFEGQELVDFLERTGMRFGPDINAYTSFDETVYQLQVATDSGDVFQTAFDVLEDWAAYATLAPKEIDKERGVVIEEWRMRQQNAQGRITEAILPALLHDSRYANRLPIGDTSVVRNASHETIRQFYEQWYRPDLMAVVAVGDFDPDRVEAIIQEQFSGLPRPDDAPPRRTFEVPGHDETIYKIITDPEMPVAAVEVSFKQEAEPAETLQDYREGLVGRMFNNMLNKRFDELANAAGSPFVNARVYEGSFVRPSRFYGLTGQVQPDSVRPGLEALLTEAERVRRHGFTASELARQKQETLRAFRRSFEERNNTQSGSLANEYVSNFLTDEPIPGIENEYEYAQQLIPDISVEEVNEQAADLLARENRVVLAILPERADVIPPTESELAAVLGRVEDKAIAPYEDTVSDTPLLSSVPDPAPVTDRREIDEVDVTELTLANGVRVVMKPTDFKEDEVRFAASSPGGSSLVTEEDYFEAANVTAIINRSGIGPFSRSELQKQLSGQVVSVAPYINELEEGLRGSASPEDMETVFQLIRLYFTSPRVDSSAFEAWQNEQRADLSNRSASPQAAFQDSVTAALYGYHPRRMPPTVDMVSRLDLKRAYEIYEDRFADASDFTFVFVGNLDQERLTELAQTYLGTLPTTERTERWRDVAPDLPEDVVSKTVHRGQDPQSLVALFFHGPFDFNRTERHRLRALQDVLQIRLREELREERSGVYSVSVQANTSSRPDSTYRLTVFFSCDPDRVDELVDAVFAEVEALKQNPPDEEYLAKVREQQRRQRETDLETNSFWVNVLDFYYTHENEDVQDVFRYEELIESLRPADIQQAAREYLDGERRVEVVLYPEDYNAAASGSTTD